MSGMLTAIALLSCDMAGPGSGLEPSESARILARVGDRTISEPQFVAELERRSGRLNPSDAPNAVRDRVLSDLIDREAQLSRAKKIGLYEDVDVQRDFEQLLLQRLSVAEVEPQLAKLEVSAGEVEVYFAAHEDEFATRERVRVAIVELERSPLASAERKADQRHEAAGLLEKAQALPAGFYGFGPIALGHSSHRASRYKGGDVGWLVRGEFRHGFDRELLEAAYALDEPGEFGPVVESENALYLVRLLEVEPRSILPLERVENAIRQRLLQQKRAETSKNWVAELREAAGVVKYDERVAAVPLPEASAVAASREAPSPPRLPGS